MKKQSKLCVIPCFKRWSRKGWSVFASIHRVVRIGVLSATMSILTLPFQTSQAQTEGITRQSNDSLSKEKLRQYQLKEAMVITQRSNPTRGIILPVEVYNRAKMQSSPLQTIESALKVNPAVDLRERGGKGAQADISLYGGTSDQTMVMLNGINFTDARTGHQSHSIPIDIEGIQEINIIGGVPGIGAFTGAVNIITAPESPKYIKTEISAGQHGYLYGNISGAIQSDGLSSMVIGSIRRSNGYVENTDFNNLNLFTRTIYESKNAGIFDFQAGYQKRFFGANSFYSKAYPNQAEETETYLSSLKWGKYLSKKLKLNAFVSYRLSTDRFELFRDSDNAPDWYTGHNYHVTHNVGSGINTDYTWIAGKTSLGVDYTSNQVYSNVLGVELSSPKPIGGELNKFYTKDDSRHILNSWLRHVAKIGKIDLMGSINVGGYTKAKAVENHKALVPSFMWSLGAGYNFTQCLSLQASAAQSMRLPTFTDLYYNTVNHIGNVDLVPEKAITYRLTGIFKGSTLTSNPALSRLNTSVSVYYRQGKNIIDWVRQYDSEIWESLQITSLNTIGTEVMASYSFKKFLREFSVGYGYIHTDKVSEDFISQYALDYLRHKVALKASLQLHKSLTLDILGTWYDRNGEYQDAEGTVLAYKPKWILDARLKWSLKKVGIFVDVTNILNTKHFDFGGLELPGTWAVAGISLTVK